MSRVGRVVVGEPWAAMLLFGAGLTVGYFLLPGSLAHSVYSSVISLYFVGAIVTALRRRRPADPTMWVLLASGTLLSISGAVVTGYLSASGEPPTPSVADVLFLSAYPLLFAGVARLGRGSARYRERERRLDALIVALGVLVVTWHPLLHPYVADSGTSTIGKLTLIAYPILDIALLYILLSAVVFAGRRDPASLLVAASFAIMLIGDFAYDLLQLHGSYTLGDPVDASWLTSYLLLAVAALHPSAAHADSNPAVATPRLWWLAMVAVASFLPTSFLLYGLAFHKDLDFVPLAGLSLVMTTLAMIRMGWMFQTLRERAAQLEYRSVELQSRSVALQQALQERDQLESDLRHQAFHDPLTGLANRALLDERIEHALARSVREHGLVALLMCDLDGFKTVNDSLGHQAGDALLVTTARRLDGVVRPGDTVARLGGDEFAILLDGVREPDIATKLAERIVTALREPAAVGGDAVTVSASIGVTVGSSVNRAEELVSNADAAMYEAKTQGKNRYIVFEPAMRSRAVERLQFTTAFAGAIDRGEFYLDYQPCFSLADGRLQSFEALVRWQHPEMGKVPPLRFIRLAEETGFILELGQWVLHTACKNAATWPAAPDGSPTLAVNVSACQLANPGFGADVRDALDTSGLPGTRLVIEVTEGTLITDRLHTMRVLDELKRIGVRVAIDDFGVGYSSLSQLRNLPVDFVKIDKSFVDDLGRGRADIDAQAEARAVVEAILHLAQDLDLTTVAEGIEVASQRDTLADLGCNIGQGFLLSHPLKPAAASVLAWRAAARASA